MSLLLHSLPSPVSVPADTVRNLLPGASRVIFLDDDPTGTQTVRDIPVLTRWTHDDVAWALRQDTPGFFVLTNTRSLDPDAAAARDRDVVGICMEVADGLGISLAFASRSDSTLRGHFPLETDVIAEVLADSGRRIDGILLAPAYIDAGRYTIDGVHYVASDGDLVPAADTEFASDATFGYTNSKLSEWVAEKSGGRISADSVLQIPLAAIRSASTFELATRLHAARDRQIIVVDAVTDDDLRAVAAAVVVAEKAGTSLIYRIGPSFVRARTGQDSAARVEADVLRRLIGSGEHGLVVVGSHVGLTSRQLDVLSRRATLTHVELDVDTIMDPTALPGHLTEVVEAAVAGLAHTTVVLSTSRTVRTGADEAASLAISRQVSDTLSAAVRAVTATVTPRFVVAKGGITSSDTATEGLHITRAWVRGPVLDGIVSLWEPVTGTTGMPYVVFPGNVGNDTALADVVDRMDAI